MTSKNETGYKVKIPLNITIIFDSDKYDNEPLDIRLDGVPLDPDTRPDIEEMLFRDQALQTHFSKELKEVKSDV